MMCASFLWRVLSNLVTSWIVDYNRGANAPFTHFWSCNGVENFLDAENFIIGKIAMYLIVTSHLIGDLKFRCWENCPKVQRTFMKFLIYSCWKKFPNHSDSTSTCHELRLYALSGTWHSIVLLKVQQTIMTRFPNFIGLFFTTEF